MIDRSQEFSGVPELDHYYKLANKMRDKVQRQINRRGPFECAGQKELRQFMDLVHRDDKLTYMQKCTILLRANCLIDNLDYQ